MHLLQVLVDFVLVKDVPVGPEVYFVEAFDLVETLRERYRSYVKRFLYAACTDPPLPELDQPEEWDKLRRELEETLEMREEDEDVWDRISIGDSVNGVVHGVSGLADG